MCKETYLFCLFDKNHVTKKHFEVKIDEKNKKFARK